MTTTVLLSPSIEGNGLGRVHGPHFVEFSIITHNIYNNSPIPIACLVELSLNLNSVPPFFYFSVRCLWTWAPPKLLLFFLCVFCLWGLVFSHCKCMSYADNSHSIYHSLAFLLWSDPQTSDSPDLLLVFESSHAQDRWLHQPSIPSLTVDYLCLSFFPPSL